jgi:iron complex transport system substrate-binding protein
MRIASLAPSNTDILVALGLESDIVGVDDWSDLPRNSEAVRIGGETSIDMAKLNELKPDLVLSSLSVPGMEKVVKGVDGLGLRQIVLNPETLDEVYANIFGVGTQTGKDIEALAVVQEIHGLANWMRERTLKCENLARVYFEWWPDPIMTPGRRSWVTDMIEIAGGRNVFGLIDERTIKITRDEVIAKGPDAIIICWCGELNKKMRVEAILAREGWGEIPAVKNKRVHRLSEAIAGRPGPKLKDGLKEMFEFLHPELK